MTYNTSEVCIWIWTGRLFLRLVYIPSTMVTAKIQTKRMQTKMLMLISL